MTSLAGGLVLGLLMAAPVAAQDRTIEDYDREVGIKYTIMYEEGGYWSGFGLLAEGGFKVCTLGTWNCQVVVEYNLQNWGDFDTTYNQFGGGIRFYRMLNSRTRLFTHFIIAFQNDGYEESNTATVWQPGGGFNYSITETIDLQVQVDIPFADYEGGVFNQFRMGFGIGIPLGGR
jgi:hypothetical protein